MFYRRGAFAAINCDRNSLPTHEILRAEGESRPSPVDACFLSVSLVLPGHDFGRDLLLAIQPSIQALPVHDADLCLRHVYPATVLGRVVELDLVQQSTRLGGRKRLVQARSVMRVQVVLHHLDLLGLGEVDFDQLLHAQGIVPPCTSLTHAYMPPAAQRLTHQQLVADAFPLVLVVHTSRRTPATPLGRSHLPKQLLAGFVEADHRIAGVVRQLVGLDHVLHAPDVVGIGVRRQAPRRHDPRLDVVFFSACRTVSTLIVSPRPSTTNSSTSSCRVQWQRPWGGSLQASWINFCSTSPLILTLPGRAGWGRWSRAAGSPSVTRRCRTRSTVCRLIPSE